MILSARAEAGAINYPWIVWLHGFLGSRDEWRPLCGHFTHWPQLFIDLPGHGASPSDATGFEALSARLDATLAHYHINDYWLVGYSLGGRAAMYHACFGKCSPCGLVIEGGHPGLKTFQERTERLNHDHRWAWRFEHQPQSCVLNDWYQQPVFAHLSLQQRLQLIELRDGQNGAALAKMLRATSTGKQPDLRAALSGLQIPFYYFYGERDAKFSAIAHTLPAFPIAIPAAGHNAHRENPTAFAHRLLDILLQSDEEKR